MYKNGVIKIDLVSPDVIVCKPFENAKQISKILNKSKSSFVVFPELSLSSYSAADLFFETNFLEENIQALKWLINNTIFKGIYIIGMPLKINELIFNVAVTIQNKKILGIVTKKTIPNYKEFNEKRWFQSGKNIINQKIILLEQEVIIGDILFVNQQFNLIFGIEICQDLWTIESPSDLLVLNGAHIIFNLSSSTEHMNKKEQRLMAVIDHSRKQIGGYFYTSGSVNEPSNETIFSNHKIAAVLGELIGEKDLSNRQEIILTIDVCIDSIKHQRIIDTTYGDQIINKKYPFEKIEFQLTETKNYIFEKNLNQKPFIAQKNLHKELALANNIQTYALQTKLNYLPQMKVILKITENIHDLLSFIVLYQVFKNLKKKLENIIIILNTSDFADQEHKIKLKELLIDLKITNIIENKHFLTSQNNEINVLSNMSIINIQNENNLFLDTYNLSDIAIGNIILTSNYDHIYNVNVGLPNTLMQKLLNYHFEKNIFNMKDELKKIYLKKITNILNTKLIIEDFILYYHFIKGIKKDKIMWFVKEAFQLPSQKILNLVNNYLKSFYHNQYKRNNISPGPKILEKSLSSKKEFQLPLNFERYI